jgi:hypothetical protein
MPGVVCARSCQQWLHRSCHDRARSQPTSKGEQLSRACAVALHVPAQRRERLVAPDLGAEPQEVHDGSLARADRDRLAGLDAQLLAAER